LSIDPTIKEKYQKELCDLEMMGFTDEGKNIRALVRTKINDFFFLDIFFGI